MLTKNDAITPYRKTHVWYDLNRASVQEPIFYFGRSANAMFRDGGLGFNQLHYTGGGWSILPYNLNSHIAVERTNSITAPLPSAGTALMAAYFEEVKTFVQPNTTLMTNVLLGASSSLATTAHVMMRKKITAGADLSTNLLSADSTAFNHPTVNNPYGIDDVIACDRVYRTTGNDTPETPVTLKVMLFGGANDKYGTPLRFYFCGPASVDKNGTGTGQYCLVFESQTHVVLQEKLNTGDWQQRYWFRLSGFHADKMFVLHILKSKLCLPTNTGNGYIDFFVETADSVDGEKTTKSNTDALIDASVYTLSHKSMKRHRYNVPGPRNQAVTVCPIRLDMRRDLFGAFRIEQASYPTTPVVATDTEFEIPFFPTTGQNFELTWEGCIPSGCSLDLKLYDASTSTELTVATTTTQKKTYIPNTNSRRYYVVATLTSNGSRTPVLSNYIVYRAGYMENTSIPSWEIGDASHPKSVVRRVQIKGAERDLSHESATIEIADPMNKVPELRLRSSMIGKIETEYDKTDSTKRCILFYGVAERADAVRNSTGDKQERLPVKGWYKFTQRWKGIWKLLEENFVGAPFLLYDRSTGQPYKVTDMMKSLIASCGFDPASDFDFPDIDIRFSVASADYSQALDALDKISDVCKSWARDYLSHFLIFDPNVGPRGKWRLIPIPTSPYTNVCKFTTDPAPAHPALIAYTYDYVYATSDPIAILSDSYSSFVTPPEANAITVMSIGNWNSEVPTKYQTQEIRNPYSFNWNGSELADGTSPDYLGRRKPMFVVDPALGVADNKEAVSAACNALARRLAYLVSHGYKTISFLAPLVLIPHESDPTKKRPLRYYDPILVNGEQFLIRNVNPDYKKDGIQYAMYEAEAPRF